MLTDGRHSEGRGGRPLLALCGVASLLSAGLLVYSQTLAFAWDEGFHLLAAQLIKAGKRPYLDFFFPQTALNAYWNAAWMRLFGESWRVAHAVAALLSAGAALLAADYLLARFPEPRWRLATALAAVVTCGLNVMVVEFGTIGQAYGLCLFLAVASFRLTILSVDRKGSLWPALAGFCAGAGAASSLLSAPVAPVLALWMLFENRCGRRFVKLAAFLAGGTVAFLPLLRLFVEAPRRVLFNVFDYHFFYRQASWDGAARQNLEVMFSWVDSSHALLLGLLAAAGLLFIGLRSEWDRRQRADFYLCGWLTLALMVHLSLVRPTFERYFLLVVPFLSILAAAGLYWVGARMLGPDRPFWPALVLTVLVSLGLAKALYEGRDDFSWSDMEEIARKVDQVTPPKSPLLADEPVYFLTRRTPPPGMESNDSHKLELPPAFAGQLRIVPQSELDKQIRARAFGTVLVCDDDEQVEELGLARLYSQRAKVQDCDVFWDKAPAPVK